MSARVALFLLFLCGPFSALATQADALQPDISDIGASLTVASDEVHKTASHRTVIIANQRTALPRLTDTLRTARKFRKRSIAELMAFRAAEDTNFANRAKSLALRMADNDRFRNPPEFYAVSSGAEFLDALIIASRTAPIKSLVLYGHAAPTALYMREDLGFYSDLNEVATKTEIVSGSLEEKRLLLWLKGARDLAQFERLLKEGHIRFAKSPVIVFTGCAVAGQKNAESQSIAWKMSDMLDATIIASIGVTDQSMARSSRGRNSEYSRHSWVRFVAHEPPEKLRSRVIDVLQYLPSGKPDF